MNCYDPKDGAAARPTYDLAAARRIRNPVEMLHGFAQNDTTDRSPGELVSRVRDSASLACPAGNCTAERLFSTSLGGYHLARALVKEKQSSLEAT